jgi:AAA domain-containing protein
VAEASQIGPADAINGIYRGNAVILAGDRTQLPPGRPFGGSVPGEQGPAEPAGTPDPDSVLDLATGSGAFGHLTLRWHYRSRHEALIAYSNAAFYHGRLLPLPVGGPDTGLELFYGQGTHRSRTSGDNPGEAARVAQRVIHHYHTRPGLSLGVVTFTQAQADAIETAVARAVQQRPGLEEYVTDGRLDGFFAKTADTVQGDERDVLIVSTGYAPDEEGKLTTGFGPLAEPGGWRRLNVAITRARCRLEIVTSIRPGDIPESVPSEALQHLRRYLAYAAHGPAPGPHLPPGTLGQATANPPPDDAAARSQTRTSR